MKRIISLFLTVMLVVNMMPIGAFAETTPVPEQTPAATTSEVATPEATPETTPETTPEATPEATPENTPETTPETTPEVTPEAENGAKIAAEPQGPQGPQQAEAESQNDRKITGEITIKSGEKQSITAKKALLYGWDIIEGTDVVAFVNHSNKRTQEFEALKPGTATVEANPKGVGKNEYYKITVVPCAHTVSFFVRRVSELPQNPAIGGSANEYLPSNENHIVQGTIGEDAYQTLKNGNIANENGILGNGSDPAQMSVPQDLSAAGVAAGQRVTWYLAQQINNSGVPNDIHIDGYISGAQTKLEYVSNFDGATTPTKTENVYTGDGITVSGELCARQGYTFLGWSTDKNATAADPAYAVGSTIVLRSALRLFGVWSKNPTPTASYTVKHMIETIVGDGEYELLESVVSSTEAEVGTTVTATPSSKVGEGFIIPEMPSGEVQLDGSLVLEVKYARNAYKITYMVNGEEISVDTYKFGQPVTVLAPSVKDTEKENFIGWDKETPETMPANNVTITAKFAKKATAEIWFYSLQDGERTQDLALAANIEGSEGGALNITKAAIEDYAACHKPDVQKKYIRFEIVQNDKVVYNSIDPQYANVKVEEIKLTAGNDTRIHIIYVLPYEVKFQYYTVQKGMETLINGGNTQSNVYTGDEVSLQKGEELIPDGFTFAKASYGSFADGEALGDTFTASGETTVNVYYEYDESKWFGVVYSTNVPNGYMATGSQNDNQRYTQGSSVLVLGGSGLEITDKDGKISHKFLGWSTDSAAKQPEYVKGDKASMPQGGLNLYAVWDIKEYQISFIDDMGNSLGGYWAEHGYIIDAPVAPEKPADSKYTYEFAGWSPEIVNATANATYQAVYERTAVEYQV
ncbi:MAG: InlB B-repeat-containing protein, partial [Oscillospiraceae bacterium]